MHILGIILLIVFAVMGALAALFLLMTWMYDRELKKLRDEGFFD